MSGRLTRTQAFRAWLIFLALPATWWVAFAVSMGLGGGLGYATVVVAVIGVVLTVSGVGSALSFFRAVREGRV